MSAQSYRNPCAVQKAVNVGDVEALISLYELDALLMIGEKQVTGRENIRAAFHSMLSLGGSSSNSARLRARFLFSSDVRSQASKHIKSN